MRAVNAVRSAIFVLFMAITVIPWALSVLVVSIFAKGNVVYWMCVGWLRTAIWGAKVICGVHARLHGFDRLPDSPVVLLPKHQSTWETFAFPGLMPHPLCYVFKRELLYVPFFGWALGMLKMVHIDRKEGKYAFESVIKQGKARMAEGAWVIMFPEGTRTPTGKQGKYKTGGARFAIATGAPVVPIAHNAGRVWPRNSFLKYAGIVTVSIGKPIDTTGLTPDEVNTRVEQWIEAEMRRIDPAAYRAADSSSAVAPI
jgi:1-acyl-sn-glycerol-3-phosphate acyltransferase